MSVVAAGAVEAYSIQFGGLPLKLRPCLDLATPTATETVAAPPPAGGVGILYLHPRLCHDVGG